MTQQPIVHIGYHKTATTWFQERFYPHVISHRFVSPQLVRESLLNPHAFGFDPEVAREALNAADKRPPILCDENLSGGFRTGGMMGALSKEVAERIYRVLPDAQVVLFIRHQVDMAAAIYAQYLKKGGTYGPRRYLFPARHDIEARRRPFKRPLFSFDYLYYRELVRHYQGLFGADNVCVFTYEDFRHEPEAFVADFRERMGVVTDTDAFDFSPSNSSFRSRTLKLSRLANLFTYKWDADKRTLLPLLPSKALNPLLEGFNRTPLAGRRLSAEELLGQDTVGFINEYFADSNRRLSDETGLALRQHIYPGCNTPQDTGMPTADQSSRAACDSLPASEHG